jgi:hypothetical protein
MSAQPVYIPERNVDVIEPGLRPRKGRVALNLVRDITFETDALRSYAFAHWQDVTCDALVLAGAVEYIDHLVKRPETGWTRRLTVRIPVHDPARWQAPKVYDALQEALRFLTGDIWEIEFVKRRSLAPRPPQEYLNLSVPTKAVLAYSDGMDSRAVAGLLGTAMGDELILVRVGSKKWDLRNGSTEAFTKVPYKVPCNMHNRETSSRTRGFKYALISGIAAQLTKAPEVIIPESGQGSIGPALITTAHSYPDFRNHPQFTVKMERFLKALLEHEVRFAFPRIWNTKGETLREFTAKPGSDWQSTRSCWRNSQWSAVNGTLRQCGVCAACMLRRVSVHAAGLVEKPEIYVSTRMTARTIEEALDPDFTRFSPAFRAYAIAGVLFMDHLAEMAKPDAAHLVKRHAVFLGPALDLDPKIAAEKLSALLQRHAAEWSTYLDHVGKNSFIVRWARYRP